MGLCSKNDRSAELARQAETERQSKISTGMTGIDKEFSRFTPEFFAARRNAYINYAMPQLGDQTQVAQKQLKYSLADRRLQNSSVASERQGAFDKEVDLQRQAIVDAAFGQSNDLEKQVQGQKSNLISQLQASADPQSVISQAAGTASSYAAPSPLQPLGNLLSNFSNLYLATQVNKTANSTPTNNNYGINLAPVSGSQQIRR